MSCDSEIIVSKIKKNRALAASFRSGNGFTSDQVEGGGGISNARSARRNFESSESQGIFL